MNPPVKDNKNTFILGLACAILLALTLSHYWYTLGNFLLNAPDSDDYIDIFWFFEIYLGAHTLSEKIYALFLPIHEHITLSSHLIYLFDYWIFKKINFVHYIFAGQIILLGICLVIASVLPATLSRFVRFAIATTLYLNLAYWHSSFWAMTSLSNQIVILFALLAARFFHHHNHYWLALGFALLGCFSQANGLAIFIALGIGIYTTPDGKQYKSRQLAIVAGLFLFVLAFHFIHQNPFDANHHLDHQLMVTEPHLAHLYQRDVSNTSSLTFSGIDAIRSFFIISGASIFDKSQTGFATALGLLLTGFWCFVFLSRHTVDRFTKIMLVFTGISILLIAGGRSAWFLEASAMQSRYRMYSFLLLALCARQVLQITDCRPRVIVVVLWVGFLLQVGSRQHWNDMAANHQMLTSSYHYWLVDGGFGRSTMPIYPPNQDRRLFIAYNTGRYNPMDAIPKRHQPLSVSHSNTQDAACSVAGNISQGGQITAYSKKAKAKATELTLHVAADIYVTNNMGQDDLTTELILCGNNHSTLITLGPGNVDRSQNRFWPVLLLKTQLPPGNYAAYIRHPSPSAFLGNISIK